MAEVLDGTNELDLNDSKTWLRGETPKDIKEKCHKLCSDYIGGVWLRTKTDDIVVNRVSGGLTNQLYYCAIEEGVRDTEADVPQEVAIRLYGIKHFNNYDNEKNERLSDTIIALMLSENNLGPKLYGLFESGQIQAYYRHRTFGGDEQKDPKLVDRLFRMLAQVHAMDVPMKRSGNWVFESFDKFYSLAEKEYDLKQLIDEYDCQTLKTYNLKEEMDWLKETVVSTDSPVVFTHVDFRGCNVMVTEPDDQMILCDFEYSCYGCRGADFGTIFAEWNGRHWSDVEVLQDFPNDMTIKPFIDSYIEESIQLNGKEFSDDSRNSFEHILKEVKVFTLAANMFLLLIILKPTETKDKFYSLKESMRLTDLIFRNYQHLKRIFCEQKCF